MGTERCKHWPRTCAQVQTVTGEEHCAFCRADGEPQMPGEVEGVVGGKQLWEAIDTLREAMGDHRGGAHPVWEAWCEENGVDWDDLRAAANAYLPSFKQWLDDSCLAEAAADMWLHAFQVGLLVARAEALSVCSQMGGDDG